MTLNSNRMFPEVQLQRGFGAEFEGHLARGGRRPHPNRGFRPHPPEHAAEILLRCVPAPIEADAGISGDDIHSCWPAEPFGIQRKRALFGIDPNAVRAAVPPLLVNS